VNQFGDAIPLEPAKTIAIEHLATGVAVLDAGLRFASVNPAFCEIVGLGERRLLGQTLAILHAGSPQLAAAAGRVSRESGSMQLGSVGICASPGKERSVDVMLSSWWPAGRSSQRQTSASGNACVLLEARAAIPASNASRLSESLRGFAHEIKNPLAAISGAAQLLQQGEHDPHRLQLTALIRDEIVRLTTLAERLLGTRASMATRAVNVHAMLERVAELLAAERADVQLVRDYDPSLPALHGDPDRLLQALINLVRNAVEANARRIVLRSRAEAGLRNSSGQAVPAIRIEIADDGDGVPSAIEATLFEPMVSGRANGSGLGLALAREIAREHGGDLMHQRKPGATCFTLVLPRRGALGSEPVRNADASVARASLNARRP